MPECGRHRTDVDLKVLKVHVAQVTHPLQDSLEAALGEPSVSIDAGSTR